MIKQEEYDLVAAVADAAEEMINANPEPGYASTWGEWVEECQECGLGDSEGWKKLLKAIALRRGK